MDKSSYQLIYFCLSVCLTAVFYLLSISVFISLSYVPSSSLPQVAGGALLALVLHPSSWFNTGTDVVESLRGPLVPLVQQQGLGAAGEDFSNQFYWRYAIGLTQQGQTQSPAALQCKCACADRGYLCMFTP